MKTVPKIKIFILFIFLLGIAVSCDNEPIRLELIQRPLDVSLSISPNFSTEFVEDRPVDIIVSIENIRVELITYNIKVLEAITRTPILIIEEPYPGSATSISVTLPPFKAGLYTVIATVTDVNNFQSATSANVAIPAVAFQEDYEDIWYLGTSNQWQDNIKFAQVGNHLWEAACVALDQEQEFILTSHPSGSECYWGEGAVVDQVGSPITLPLVCDSVNYIYAQQRPLIAQVPPGQYSLRFDDITNELTVLPVDGCLGQIGRPPMKITGSAVSDYHPGADYFKLTNQLDQLVMYFQNGSFALVDNDGSGTAWGGLGDDGQLLAGGTPISIEEGLYHLSLDAATMRLTITRIEALSIVGDLDWSQDRPLIPDPLHPWVWSAQGLVLETGNIRFRANNDWGISWGDPDGDILLTYGGGNIEVEAGVYDISINVLANNYLIEK